MVHSCDTTEHGSEGFLSQAFRDEATGSLPLEGAMECAIDQNPLNLAHLRDSVPALGDTGGYVVFEGIVRNVNHGKRVTQLEYEAFDRLAIKEMMGIAHEARERFALRWVRSVHRVGVLGIGETAVVIQVLARHRQEAFAGCHWIIDQIKMRVPIWKKEFYDDGSTSWTRCMDHARASPPTSERS